MVPPGPAIPELMGLDEGGGLPIWQRRRGAVFAEGGSGVLPLSLLGCSWWALGGLHGVGGGMLG